ncbi:MAG: hypothetical protein Q8L36_02870 [bacterium]|nr:hypothetical protein [bacterium]
MSTIKDFLRERKDWIIFWTFLFLIVSLSFGLGYLTAKDNNPAPIIINKISKN